MTQRLYYTDSYAQRFSGRIVEATPVAGRHCAVLDQSLFYPTSGGQPHDTGRLGESRVLEVTVREADGAVLHLLDLPLPPGPVEGEIDWPRRFDHMQQHTGQHILSQAFERAAQAPTISFHLGADYVSIDLGIPSLTDAAITDAESLANQVVSSNTAVRAWFPAEEELRSLALRKQPDVKGPVRVVAIGDFDLSACGGTHVATTGEIGMIAVLKSERLKRGVRIEFLCGSRARTDYARKHAILRELAGSLTCAPSELTGSVARLQASLQETRRELAAQQERALDDEATRLLAEATIRKGYRVIRAAWAERDMAQLKGLALRLTEPAGMVSLLGVAGSRSQILFGRSADVSIDLKPVFDATLAALGGGRGGGARLLQGAAGSADLAALEQALRSAEAALPNGSA
jgi:alanyl-tRNA synthetase